VNLSFGFQNKKVLLLTFFDRQKKMRAHSPLRSAIPTEGAGSVHSLRRAGPPRFSAKGTPSYFVPIPNVPIKELTGPARETYLVRPTVIRDQDMFNLLVVILAHVLSWMFVIGMAGTVFLVIPFAAYQLIKVLFEKDHPDEIGPSPNGRPSSAIR